MADATAAPAGPRPLKIAVLGDSGVGKTKLLERFLFGVPQPLDTPTHTAMVYSRLVRIDGVSAPILVEFWEASGMLLQSQPSPTTTASTRSEHPSLRGVLHRADAVLLVFDASQRLSYRSLPRWLSAVTAYCPYLLPVSPPDTPAPASASASVTATSPVLVAAAKSDLNPAVWEMSFNFSVLNNLAAVRVCPPSIPATVETGAGAGTGDSSRQEWGTGEGVIAEAIKAGLAWRRARSVSRDVSGNVGGTVSGDVSDGAQGPAKVHVMEGPSAAATAATTASAVKTGAAAAAAAAAAEAAAAAAGGEGMGGAVEPGALAVQGFVLPAASEAATGAAAAAVAAAGSGSYESELLAVLEYLDAK